MNSTSLGNSASRTCGALASFTESSIYILYSHLHVYTSGKVYQELQPSIYVCIAVVILPVDVNVFMVGPDKPMVSKQLFQAC